jgi:hypothetical protein
VRDRVGDHSHKFGIYYSLAMPVNNGTQVSGSKDIN